MIDKEVKEFVEGGLKRALSVIEANRDKLELLAQTLLEREQMDGDTMNKLMRGETLPPYDSPRKGDPMVIAPGPGPELTPANPLPAAEGIGPGTAAPTPAS
jgi:cell division protease FtsH